jgi:hypothetical protein
MGKSFFGAKNIVQNPGHVVSWHIASFRCTSEIGRYPSKADIDQTGSIKLD